MVSEAIILFWVLISSIAGAVLRSYLGWLKSEETFDWKLFLKTTLPAVLAVVAGAVLFDYNSIITISSWVDVFRLSVIVGLGAAGFGTLQSKFT